MFFVPGVEKRRGVEVRLDASTTTSEAICSLPRFWGERLQRGESSREREAEIADVENTYG